MSRQDIYATIWDDALGDCGHSSSRRGKVENISINVSNDWTQHKIELEIKTSGKFIKNDIELCNERIKHFTKLGNKKKIEFWGKRLADWSIENADLENSEFVRANLDFPFHVEPLRLCINNTFFSEKEFKLLELINGKKWKDVLNILAKDFNNGIDINNEILSEKI